jgi:WD40 repeat protein
LNSDDPTAKSVVLRGHSEAVTRAIASPDSHWLATASDNSVRLWDLMAANPSSAPVVLSTEQQHLDSLIFSPDSKMLASSAEGSSSASEVTSLVWDLAEPTKPPRRIKVKGKVAGVVLLVNVYGLIVQRGEEKTFIYSVDETVNEGFDLGGALVGMSSDDRLLVTMNMDWLSTAQGLRQIFAGSLNLDMNLRLWNFNSEQALASPLILRGHEGLTTALNFSKDDHFLVTGGSDNAIRVWNLTNPLAIFTTPLTMTNPIRDSLHADSRWLATRGPEHTIRVWDVSSSDPTAAPIVLHGHRDKVDDVVVSPNNRWLATSSQDHTIRLWDMQSANPSTSQKVLQENAFNLAFSTDNHWLAATDGKFIRVWDVAAADPRVNLKSFATSESLISAYGVYVSPDRQWLIDFRSQRVWNLIEENVNLPRDLKNVDSVTISDNRQWLVLNRIDTLELWNLRDQNPAARGRELEGASSPIAFSPDHRWLFTNKNGKSYLWDLNASNRANQPLILPGELVYNPKQAVFSPNGKWLAVSGNDDTALVWNLQDLASKPIVLRGENSNLNVQSMDISPDSRWLATISFGNVNMWDLNARNPAAVRVVLPGSRLYEDLAFSRYDSKGKWLLVQDNNETIALWNLQREALVQQACHTAGRSLTDKEWNEYFPGEPYRKTCPDFPGQQ